MGHLPLNIIKVSKGNTTSAIINIVRQITSLTHSIPLEIDYLNENCWVAPDQNRSNGGQDYGLCSGELQLMPSTWVLIDETVMDKGTLTQRGLANIQALNDVISGGILNYGLNFGILETKVDFQMMVVDFRTFCNHNRS